MTKKTLIQWIRQGQVFCSVPGCAWLADVAARRPDDKIWELLCSNHLFAQAGAIATEAESQKSLTNLAPDSRPSDL